MTNNDSNITLNGLLNELDAHDWYYGYSDDSKAYKNGCDNSARLQAIAEQLAAYKALYKEYIEYINNDAEKPTVSNDDSEQAETTSTTGFTLNNLYKLAADGKIFQVEFIKRTTGELRKIRCRLGVKKHLKGGKKTYSPKDKHLLTVFDMEAKGYRSIPVEGIRLLKVGAQSFVTA